MFSPQDALPLPPRPSLEQYKKLAKDLLKAARSSDPRSLRAWATIWIDSITRLTNLSITPGLPIQLDHWTDQLEAFAREKMSAAGSLTSAQFILARAHGFESWPKLAQHIAAISRKNSPTSNFEQAADAIINGDRATLELLLRKYPRLIEARSTRQHQATLLHYVAANGVEGYRQKTPPNAVEIAQLILNAGAAINATANVYGAKATTLPLVATSIHPEQAGLQVSLMELLLDRGASMNQEPENLIAACLANGRLLAAEFLARRGAPLDLVSAAGLGNLDVVKSYFDASGKLSPNTRPDQVHRALFWSSEYGRNQVVEFLLDHGASLDARSADGQTALHWAIIGGHLDTVKLLLSRGAAVEAKNNYGGTPLAQAHWSATHAPKKIDYVAIIALLTNSTSNSE